MKSDALKFWEAERDRVAAGIRHHRISTQDGTVMLAEIEERIAEHAHGIVPETEAEELPTETAPAAAAATNVTQMQPARAQRNEAALKRQAAIRDAALAKYRKDMKGRTGRDPLASHVRLALNQLRFGQPMMCPPLLMLELGEDRP